MMFPWPWRRVESRRVDQRLFREAMGQPSVSRELFLPLERAWWDGGRFTLGRWKMRVPRPALRGVRLQEPRPATQGPPPERDTQADLSALVGSVAELRRVPELSGLVLSDETLVGSQQGMISGKRVLFGLSCPAGGQFEDEKLAAAECHRVLDRTLKQAGFAIDHPRQPFDPSNGFPGLRNWASTIRLKRRGPRRGLLFLALLILLPILLMFVPIPGTGSMPMPGAAPPPGLPGGAAAGGADPASAMKSLTGGKDLDQLVKDLETAQKQMGATSGNNPQSLLGGTGVGEGASRNGYLLFQVGTGLYFVSGAWLIWAAEAGILAVIGLLILPGYPLALARKNWSRTWIPMLLHMASIVLIIVGIYYWFLPYFQLMNSLLG